MKDTRMAIFANLRGQRAFRDKNALAVAYGWRRQLGDGRLWQLQVFYQVIDVQVKEPKHGEEAHSATAIVLRDWLA